MPSITGILAECAAGFEFRLLTERSRFIHVAAVRYPRHIYSSRGIVDYVDNTVITNPDSPTVFITVKLSASWRSRVIGEFTYL